MTPIHDDGELLGYAVNRAHHADVGGSAPGSMPAGATEIFQEGLRIPPVRLWREGREDPDVLDLLLANSRTPDERRGDLRAQVGANHTAAARLTELAGRMGIEELLVGMEATKDHAERAVRTALTNILPGTYRFEDLLDDDGAGTVDIPIRVAVTIGEGHMRVDFAGTSRQGTGQKGEPQAHRKRPLAETLSGFCVVRPR